MTKYKPVSVSKAGFAFCRYSVAVLVWAALILKIKWLLLPVFFILALSAILKVQKAPMILLYNWTVGKIIKSKEEILNERAMQFAHTMGTVLCFICVLFLYLINPFVGWILAGFFAVLKTISAVGMCPASKLYECMGNKNCCVFAKRL